MTRRGGRIGDIEVLRGIAILLVLAMHLNVGLLTWSPQVLRHITAHYVNFWPGVDLFFVVSGFVIARSLVPALRAAPDGPAFLRAMVVFWVRRAWRLLPAAWMWLAIILVLAGGFNRNYAFGFFHDNFETAVAALMGVANIHFAMIVTDGGGLGTAAPYWSLSLEEQFYLLLPLVVWLSGRRLPAVLLGVFALFAWLPETKWLASLRMQGPILGVLLALLTTTPAWRMLEPRGLARAWAGRAACTVVPIAAMCALAPADQRIFPHALDLVALLAAFPVFLASYDAGYVFPRGISRRVLIWFGSRSYALYLAHTPCYRGTGALLSRLLSSGAAPGPADTLPFLLVGLSLTLAAAELTHRLVEMPFRAHGRRVAARMIAA